MKNIKAEIEALESRLVTAKTYEFSPSEIKVIKEGLGILVSDYAGVSGYDGSVKKAEALLSKL